MKRIEKEIKRQKDKMESYLERFSKEPHILERAHTINRIAICISFLEYAINWDDFDTDELEALKIIKQKLTDYRGTLINTIIYEHNSNSLWKNKQQLSAYDYTINVINDLIDMVGADKHNQ
jgi:hypothetical protein